jgi:putative hemolysin
MVSDNDFLVIDGIDLEPIKQKLMHGKAGKGWTRHRAEAVEREYRRFLYLAKTYPDAPLAPIVDVDEFWHYHILDTKKYMADCQTIFGYFLHHFPYAGMRGKEDEQALQRVGNHTRDMYEQTFGERYVSSCADTAEPVRTAQSAAVRLSNAYGATPMAPAFFYLERPAVESGAKAQSRFAKGVAHDVQPAFCYTPDAHTEIETAFCYTPTKATAETAFCYTPDAKTAAGTAFCFTPDAKTAAETAFCYAPDAKTVAETAFCYTPDEKSAAATAFCYTPDAKTAAETAFCYTPDAKTAAETAFCYTPDAKTAAETAFCYTPDAKTAAEASFCYTPGAWTNPQLSARPLEECASSYIDRPRLSSS